MNAPSRSALAPPRSWQPQHTAPHYLWLGLAASLLVHAALMAWQPDSPATPVTQSSTLEVTLVNAHSTDAPAKPQVLAQSNVDGGGDATQGMATSPLPHTGESANTIVLEALRRRQAELEAEQIKLLALLQSKRQSAQARDAATAETSTQVGDADDVDQDSVVLNARIAALAERIQAYNQSPRKQFVAPATAQAAHAAYVDAWRTRVEAAGTQHYPQEARGRIYGSLQMTVYIRRDGSLIDATIDLPADEQVLNLAARRIVQLASPFPPFPQELAAQTDVLAITRTWHFVNDALTMQAP